MPQADIEINGTAASDEDLPISTLVQLSNNDVGDETTYLWEIVSQPPGAADPLSATAIENPTVTPNKEDTYLVKLTVDLGLGTESIDQKVFRIRRFKTDSALIAPQETVQSLAGNWATPQNETLARHDNQIYAGTVVACVANGALAAGNTVELDGIATIKSGLPGEERLPQATPILATDAAVATKVVGVVLSASDGNTAVANGAVALILFTGLLDNVTHLGSPTVGDPVYVTDTGVLGLAAGSNVRQLGIVVDATVGSWKALITSFL